MVALIILGILAAIIILILLLPIGADIGYENGLLHVSAKAGPLLLQLFPRHREKERKQKPPKPPKEKKEEKSAEEKPKEKKERKLNFNFDEIMELVQIALRSLGRFGKKFKVDRFVFHFLAAGRDPYNTVMAYNTVNAALSSLGPLCAERFHVKNSDVWTDIDFTTEDFHIDFALAMTVRIGQIFGLVFAIGFGALKILLRNKKRLKREAADAAKAEPVEAEPGEGPEQLSSGGETPKEQDPSDCGIEKNTIDNTQDVERKKANGNESDR